MKLIWKRVAGGFGESYNGYLGDVRCFTICYSALKPHGDPNPYTLASYLPGVESKDGKSLAELHQVAFDEVYKWLKRIGVKATLE